MKKFNIKEYKMFAAYISSLRKDGKLHKKEYKKSKKIRIKTGNKSYVSTDKQRRKSNIHNYHTFIYEGKKWYGFTTRNGANSKIVFLNMDRTVIEKKLPTGLLYLLEYSERHDKHVLEDFSK